MRESDLDRQVLVVDDEAVVRTGIAQVLSQQDLAVATAAGTQALAPWPASRLVSSCWTSSCRTWTGWSAEAPPAGFSGYRSHHDHRLPHHYRGGGCIRLGALDYLVKPFRSRNWKRWCRRPGTLSQKNQRAVPNRRAGLLGLDFIIGQSPAMRRVFDKIKRAAPSDSTVLLTGESGTGKELVARAIHLLSPRGTRNSCRWTAPPWWRPCWKASSSAMSRALLPGPADQTRPLRTGQPRHLFLRRDQQSEPEYPGQAPPGDPGTGIHAGGESEAHQTGYPHHRFLQPGLNEAIKAGAFREDLFYRLSVIPIHLPPLRERTGDLPLLADHFLRRYSQKGHREVTGISGQALKMLIAMAGRAMSGSWSTPSNAS